MSTRTFWVLGAAGFAVAAFMALFARGLASDEEVGHFQIARYALAHPHLFLDTYGRPLVTLGFSLPAQAGLWTARLFGAVLAGLTTVAVARTVVPGRWYPVAFVPVVLFLQPYYLGHAAVVMTETWAAFLVAGGLLAFTERRWSLLAVIAGLLPVARQEWLVFWPVVAWILVRGGRLRLLPVIPLPMAAWALTGGLVYGDLLWIVRQVGWRAYPARELLHYPKSFAWIVGTGLVVPVCLGIVRGALSAFGWERASPGGRALVAAATMVLVMIPVYTVFAVWHPITFGMHRFFAGLAGPIAVLAMAGLGWFTGRDRRVIWGTLIAALAGSVFMWGRPIHTDMTILARRDYLPAATALAWLVLYIIPGRARHAAALLVLVSGVFFLVRSHIDTLHLVPSGEHEALIRTAGLIPGGSADVPILQAHPVVPFRLGLDPNDRERFPPTTPESLNRAGAGTLLVWDSHYIPGHGPAYSLKSIHESRGWEFLGGFVARDSTAAAGLFRRAAVQDTLLPATQARWAEAARMIQAGIPRLRAKVRDDPGNATMIRALADRCYRVGLLGEATRLVARARELDPDHPDNVLILASIYHARRDLPRALEIGQGALARHPDNGHLEYLVGRVLLDMRQPDRARPHVLRAADLLPEERDVQFVAGGMLLNQHRWREAERYLEAARIQDPDHPETLFYLAEALRQQNRLEEAGTCLRRLLEVDPKHVRGYIMTAEVLAREGRMNEARQILETGYRETGDSSIRDRIRSAR